MNEHIIKAFKTLANDILSLFQTVLESDIGINRKPRAEGKNTLKNSRLARTKEIQFDVPFLYLILNDYIYDIENGRKVGARPLVPISDLREWADRNNIPSDNHTLMLIQAAIFKDGIKGRPVMKTFWRLMDEEWKDTYSTLLFNSIMEELEQYFNKG